jgi:hypothetical protein
MSDREQKGLAPTKRRDEVRVFLERGSEVLRAGGGPTYDLATEYAKTRKNRTVFVPLIIGAVILAVAAAALVTTSLIDAQTRRVSVDITAFEDLNLKDLLDVAKRNIEEMDRAILERDALEKELASGLDGIALELASLRKVNQSLGLSAAELAAKSRETEAPLLAKEKALRQRLEPLIIDVKQRIADLEVRIAAYDQRGLEQARKQQEALDNQDQKFAIEKQQLTDQYEAQIAQLEKTLAAERREADARVQRTAAALTDRYTRELAAMEAKYNPSWDDAKAQAMAASADRTPAAPLLPVPAALPAEFPLPASVHGDFQAAFGSLREALARLRTVPYINAVPSYLKASEAATGDMAAGYLKLLDAAVAAIRDRNAGISARDGTIGRLTASLDHTQAVRGQFDYGLSFFSRSEGDAGFVVDPRDGQNILVFVDPLYQNVDSVRAWVFRTDDAPVAELILHRRGAEVVGTVVKIETDMTLLPFDRILLGTVEEVAQ